MCDIFIMCFVLSEILSFFVFWVEFQCCCWWCCGGGEGGWCCSMSRRVCLFLLLLRRQRMLLLLLCILDYVISPRETLHRKCNLSCAWPYTTYGKKSFIFAAAFRDISGGRTASPSSEAWFNSGMTRNVIVFRMHLFLLSVCCYIWSLLYFIILCSHIF